MKGIVLAGGHGRRLAPLTAVISKHLFPVYDKPMIYYSLSTVMLAGIRDVLLICTPQHLPLFQSLLGNGRQWGIRLSYQVQGEPAGIAEALLIGESFLDGGPCCLTLGDNLLYGHGLVGVLRSAAELGDGARIFASEVKDPNRYGVVTLDDEGRPIALDEKPQQPTSNLAIAGVYFYDHRASGFAKRLDRSHRGELEITDLNRLYLQHGSLRVEVLGRGTAWFDTGTQDSLLEASSFVSTIAHRSGLKIGCPEEIAYRQGWITAGQLAELAARVGDNDYGRYLRRISMLAP